MSSSFNCLLFNVGCDNDNICKDGHCMLMDSGSGQKFTRKDIDNYFELLTDDISVGIFQEVCNNELSGIRNSILTKFTNYNLSPYKGEIKKTYMDDILPIVKHDLNKIDSDDIDYTIYFDLEKNEKTTIDISKDLMICTNKCELFNLFDLLFNHYDIATFNNYPYNNINGCKFGEQYIDDKKYFYKLDETNLTNNLFIKINDVYAISPFKYYRADLIKYNDQCVIFINIHVNPHLNTTELYSDIKNAILNSIIKIKEEIYKYLIINPHIIILGDFNEGHYFVDKTTCIKNDKVYGKNSNEIISKKLMDSFGLVCAKNKIIEFYKEFNCKKNKKTQEKKCHLNILHSSSLQIEIINKIITDNNFINNISSHLPILFKCTFMDTKIHIISNCRMNMNALIIDVCKKNECIDSDKLILLLYAKIIKTSDSYYEFSKKSLFLCKADLRHKDIYHTIKKILIEKTDLNLNETVDKIFDLIMQNYKINESNLNGGSNQSYYLKYIKYKNKYNNINKNNINKCN